MNDYQTDLKKRQEEHLEKVRSFRENSRPFIACQHDLCPECIGTGVKLNGSPCVHYLYCGCPKCSPTFSVSVPSVISFTSIY